MKRVSNRIVIFAMACSVLVILNSSALVFGDPSEEPVKTEAKVEDTVTNRFDATRFDAARLDGLWVDSFVTVHWNYSPEEWNYVPKDSTVVYHSSKLALEQGKFTLRVRPRILIHGLNSMVRGYDTLTLELEGVFYVVGDTLRLRFEDESETGTEKFSYKFYGDSLRLQSLTSGTEVSPGLWSVNDRTLLWGGLMSKRAGMFQRLKSEE